MTKPIKARRLDIVPEILPYTPLILAVLIGGTIGNIISIRMLKPEHLRRITGLLIIAVAIRLLLKWAELLAAYMA